MARQLDSEEMGTGVRVYISVDMEGIAGVNHPGPARRDDVEYGEKVRLMAGETNAAIEGARAAGADEILVNDSHGAMHNLGPADVDPAARLLQGEKAWSMVAGASPVAGGAQVGGAAEAGGSLPPAFDVALFVGYHARAGHPTAVLGHTYSGRPTSTTLNGRPVGESGINALVLGAWGIPVGLVTGDDGLAEETETWLPWAERVIVKQGFGRHAAASVHPSKACDLVRAGAERAVRRAADGDLKPLVIDPPIVLEVDFADPVMADFAAIQPLAERAGDRGIRIATDDAVSAYRGFLAAVRLAGITVR